MGLAVAHAEAHEGPPRAWIGVRRSLAGQVGQENQPLAARRYTGRLAHQLVVALTRRKRIAIPAQAAARREHHAHQVPSPWHGVTESVQPPTWLNPVAVGVGKYHPRCADRHRNDPLAHNARAHRLGRLVACPGHHWRARQQAGGRRARRVDLRAHHRRLAHLGEPGARNAQLGQQLIGPAPVAHIE